MATTQAPQKRQSKKRGAEVKRWALPGIDELFIQDPLTFFEKTEFLGLVSRLLETAVNRGMNTADILALLGTDEETFRKAQRGEMDFTQLSIVNSIVSVIGTVGAAATEVLEEAYLLFLSVPAERHDDVRPALRQIDDDTGFGMLEAFIDQNAETIKDFLPRWGTLLTGTMTKFRSETSTSEEG